MRNFVSFHFSILLFWYFSPCGLSANVEFVQQPQNYKPVLHPIVLNCSTNIPPLYGFDWTAVVLGESVPDKKLCEAIVLTTHCIGGYNVSQPDNRTSILSINPLHANFTGFPDSICCQHDNGQGHKSCANRTDASSSETTVAMTSTTYSAVPESHITTESSSVSPDSSSHSVTIAISVLFAVVCIGLVIVIVYCVKRHWLNRAVSTRPNVHYSRPETVQT